MTRARKINQSPKLPPAERRRQLLGAAHRLFLKKGYRGTTVDAIAHAAGVTKGALYFHFRSKEDILLEMVKGFTDHLQKTVEDLLPSRVSLSELFRVLLTVHFECKPCDKSEMVDIWVQARRMPKIKRYIANRHRKLHQFYQSHLDPASIPKGTDPHTVAVLISALVHGLATTRMVLPKAVDLPAQRALLDALVGPDQPQTQGRRRKAVAK